MALQKGLVGHWSLDSRDIDNGLVRDRSAYDRHGAINGSPATGGSGFIRQAVDFGKSTFVSADGLRSVTNGVSLSFWTNPRSYRSGNSWLFNLWSDKNNRFGLFDDGSDLIAYAKLSGTAYSTKYPTLSTDTWHHVVGVLSKNTVQLYVDGVKVSESPNSGDITKITSPTAYLNDADGNGNYGTDQKLDDVRVYNRALSQSEITQLYNQRSTRTQKTKNFVKAELYEPGGRASDKQSLDSYYTDSNFVKVRVHNRPHIYFGNGGQNAGFGSVNGYPSYFDGINKDNYSWRMRVNFIAPESGTYEFGVDSDDASDLLIDGNAVATFYGGHGFDGDLRNHTGTIDLNQGNSYQLQARFQEGGGGDGIAVGWKKPSDSSFEKFPLKITNQSQIDI